MPGARSTVWSADAWNFNYALLDIKTGKGKDEFLSEEPIEANVTYTQGLDGEGVFNQTNATGTKIKLTLLQTSEGNATLSAIKIASDAAGGLPAPLAVQDGKGTSKTISAAAMITQLPPTAAQKEAGQTVWEFLVHDPARFVGSH